MLPGLENCSCGERLDRLRFFSLEQRRLREDLIEMNKTVRGLNRVNGKGLFTLAERSGGIDLK